MTSSEKPAAPAPGAAAPELVNVTIDGKQIRVAKGTNLIEAAKSAGIEVPYYCYHPHLSIAGNCRMCQVKIKGAPKLDIACNTLVREGMEVQTHFTSKEVDDAQAATLEFILINHPLDCTICDQAGHCKLQDYHFDYNARPSRFLEQKVHKVKAESLGPTVVLDGERCIMCTRCVRFCDEVTQTSELGMLNRGDRAVIAINPGKELNNPLSGTVVDLCPVGALTHKEWRFNTRIWFTKETSTICPGCSTGCNAKVAVRDGEVVQVKARLNSEVNKEWMCDEGRYGFSRFLPQTRVTFEGGAAQLTSAIGDAKRMITPDALVFVAPDLLLEEYDLLKSLLASSLSRASVVVQAVSRQLTEVEAILISPDYAANYRGAEFAGLVQGALEKSYREALSRVLSKQVQSVIIIGDRAIASADLTDELVASLRSIGNVVSILTDKTSPLYSASKVVLPGRSILEKAGLLINRNERLQYTDRVIDFPPGTEPEWRLLSLLAAELGAPASSVQTERELTLKYLAKESRLAGLRIASIKAGGVCLKSYRPSATSGAGTNGTGHGSERPTASA